MLAHRGGAIITKVDITMPEIKNVLNNAMNISKLLLQVILAPGDRVIDATLGNGHDAIYLAQKVGNTGKVYAFDIQDIAIESARHNIPEELLGRIQIIKASHENMSQYVHEPVKLVLFNLGYLPCGDRSITTRAATTVEAIRNSLSLLSEHGLVMLIVYRGHDEGKEEWQTIYEYVRSLEQHMYNVTVADFPNQISDPPVLVSIQKRS